MSKINLTEATMLALQGKLDLDAKKPMVESLNISTENGTNISVEDDITSIDSKEASITITNDNNDTDTSIVELPVKSDDTVIPEDIVEDDVFDDTILPEETIEETSKEITDDVEETAVESKMCETSPEHYTMEDFTKIMRDAVAEGKILKGVIVFTEDSFNTPYTVEERSYKVDNEHSKFFNTNMIGNSLYGDCLDGQDLGVRLDNYLDDWAVDFCYFIDDVEKTDDIKETEEVVTESKKLQEWIRDTYDLKQFLAYEIGNKKPELKEKINIDNFDDDEIVNVIFDKIHAEFDYMLDNAIDEYLDETSVESEKTENKKLQEDVSAYSDMDYFKRLITEFAIALDDMGEDDSKYQNLINKEDNLNLLAKTFKDDDYLWENIEDALKSYMDDLLAGKVIETKACTKNKKLQEDISAAPFRDLMYDCLNDDIEPAETMANRMLKAWSDADCQGYCEEYELVEPYKDYSDEEHYYKDIYGNIRDKSGQITGNVDELEESKDDEIAKVNLESFNENMNTAFKKLYPNTKGVKVESVSIAPESLLIEGKIQISDKVSRRLQLEMHKAGEFRNQTKYILENKIYSRNLKTESASKTNQMVFYTSSKNKVLECRSILAKKNRKETN